MTNHPEARFEAFQSRRSKWPSKIASVVSAAAILVSTGVVTVAQEACTSMQVYLAIAPNHREDVMAYIAPKLKEKFNVELVAEAIGSVMMVPLRPCKPFPRRPNFFRASSESLWCSGGGFP